MPEMEISVEDVGVLASAYPNRSEWERVSYDGTHLIWPEDLNPSIASIDLTAARKADLIAHARMRRWQIETGGTTVGGVPVSTDDRSKLLLQGARTSADQDENFTTEWDAGDQSVTLNATQIIAMSNAVRDHVAAVFARFSEIREEINAGVITSKEGVNNAFMS